MMAEALSFYHTPSFWVMVSFLIAILLFGRKVFTVVSTMLDEHSRKIAQQIEEAERLKEEAQELFAECEKKQHDALQESKDIVLQAEKEAIALTDMLQKECERVLERREQQAVERLAQAEANAVIELREEAVNLVIRSVHSVLMTPGMDGPIDLLVAQSIKALPEKIPFLRQ